MGFTESVEAWAKGKKYVPQDAVKISLDTDIDPGYDCCGGSDPLCYCSLVESPSVRIQVTWLDADGKFYYKDLGYGYDMSSLVTELSQY